MRRISVLLALPFILALSISAAETPSFAGEYADKKFLNGNAVFQMSIEGGGNNVQVWFSAGRSDGQGADPEAQGMGKVTGKGRLDFKFTDSFKNSGTGTITRSGDDVVVSIKTTHVADSRCLPFYGQNMRLKRAKSKFGSSSVVDEGLYTMGRKVPTISCRQAVI